MDRLAGLTSTLASEINAIEQRKKRPADAQAYLAWNDESYELLHHPLVLASSIYSKRH